MLKEKQTVYFQDLFSDSKTLGEFVVTFLALLELVRMSLIRIFQPELDKDIRLEAHFDEEDDLNEQIAEIDS